MPRNKQRGSAGRQRSECVSAEKECGGGGGVGEGWRVREMIVAGGAGGKEQSAYHAGRSWKALRALEKQVNPEPWLLYGADVIWLCA